MSTTILAILRQLILSLDDEEGVPIMTYHAIADLAVIGLGSASVKVLNNATPFQDGRAFLKEGEGEEIWERMVQVMDFGNP